MQNDPARQRSKGGRIEGGGTPWLVFHGCLRDLEPPAREIPGGPSQPSLVMYSGITLALLSSQYGHQSNPNPQVSVMAIQHKE